MTIRSDKERKGPSVSVIVPNWNGRACLERCLGSLEAQTYAGPEIVVVDNGSTDDSVAFIRKHFPDVKVLETGFNAGFAAAVNRGIRETESDYVALLNNDAVASEDWLAEMVKAMEKDARLGSCASKVMLLNTPEVINCAGLAFDFKFSACSRVLGWNEPDCLEYDVPQAVLSASGAAALYRREALDEVGLMDEDFFLYYEDFDLGLRLQLAGYDCLYLPSALAYHDDKAAARSHSDEIIEMNRRNSRWVVLKCLPAALLLPALVPYLLVGFYRRLRHRTPSGQLAQLREWMEQVKEKRKTVQSKRKSGLGRLIHVLLRPSRLYGRQSKVAPTSDCCPVALVSHSYDLGGTEECLRRQALSLKRLGHAPLVIVPAPGRLARNLLAEGIRTKIMPYQWWVYPEQKSLGEKLSILWSVRQEARRMCSWFRKEQIKLVDSASSVIPQGALAARRAGAKHIWHVRELYSPESPGPVTGIKMMRWLIQLLADKIVVPSRAAARLLADSPKVMIIPEGIEVVSARPALGKRKTLRQRIGAKKDEHLVVVIGVVRPGKDQLTAVRFIGELKKTGIKAHLVLCGATQEEYKELLMDEIKSLDIGPYVHFLGYQFDVDDVLAEADVLLVTSLSESFGLAILEAMARRVPVIATRCGGPEELVVDGVTGWLVGIGDYRAFARIFRKLIDEPAQRKKLVDQAWQKVQQYDAGPVYQEHLKVYRDVCSCFDRHGGLTEDVERGQ